VVIVIMLVVGGEGHTMPSWRRDAEAPGSVPQMLGIRADHSESTAGSSHGSAYVAWSIGAGEHGEKWFRSLKGGEVTVYDDTTNLETGREGAPNGGLVEADSIQY